MRFFRKTAYQAAGGYDEALVSGEDWDLTKKIERMGAITRISELIYHNEERITLWRTLQKKYYYANHAKAFLSRNPEKSKLLAQVGPIERYKLFLSQPRKLLANPFLGVAMLTMKTAEFASGGLGYVMSGPSQSREGETMEGMVGMTVPP